MDWIDDRFAFDNKFRILLKKGFSIEDAKIFIMNNYSLSALVFQERIENGFYKNISIDENISTDLLEFRNAIYYGIFLNRN